MQITLATIRTKVRNALDDIAPSVVDDFSANTDAEIDQAVMHAVTSLSQTLPMNLLMPSVENGEGVHTEDQGGYVVTPDDYLRFVSVAVEGWKGPVSELMERGSEAEKMQRSKWSRGSDTKPRAMMDGASVDGETKQIIRYWPSHTDDEDVTIVYIQAPTISSGTISCALKDEAEKNVIYLACQIFLEGKKENTTAEAFAKLSEL